MAQKKDVLAGLTGDLTIATVLANGQFDNNMKTEEMPNQGGGFSAELNQLLARKLKRELDDEERQEEELRVFLKARSESYKEEEERRRMLQDHGCNHRKEGGASCLVAQRTSDGLTPHFCQHCFKHFRDFMDVPMSLRISPELIGG